MKYNCFLFFRFEEKVGYTLMLLSFFMLLVSSSVCSQKITESVNAIYYLVNDGLPSTETYDVFQDSNGFIWVGTDKGIAKFDGSKFETYTVNDGLTDNLVFRFIEDQKGRIWLITYNRKLCYYKDKQFHAYEFNHVIDENLHNLHDGITITDIEVDEEDNIAINLLDYTRLIVDNKGKALKSSSPYKDRLQSIAGIKSNEIKILTVLNDVLSNSFRGQKLPVKFDHHYIFNFYKSDNYIIKTGKNGVSFYNTLTGEIEKSILNTFFVTGMTVDFEGGQWYSTLNSGIIYISDPEITFFSTKSLSHKPAITSILTQDNELIFSFKKKDYTHYRIVKGQKNLIPFIEKLRVDHIPDTQLKVGIKFENPLTIFPLSAPVRAILKIDSNHLLYASNYGGIVNCKKNKNNIWQEWFIPGPKINKIIQDKKGIIWLGAYNGLHTFNSKTGKITKDSTHSFLMSQRIQDLCLMKDNSLIIATHTSGIFIMNTDLIKRYTKENGLVSNYINHLIYNPNSNVLWVATNKGICNFSYKNKTLSKPKNSTGLLSSIASIDVRLIHLKDSMLYFVSNEGVSYVNTKKVKKQEVKPKIYLKEIVVNDKSLYAFDNLKFDYNQNNLSLNFRGISFNSLNNLKYEFKLEGLHPEYRVSESANFDFFALSPGNYTFQISAVNREGLKSIPISISFSISPPFWLSWWFKLTIILIASFLIYFYVREVIKRYEMKTQLEVNLMRLKSMNLQSKMNPHFIFNSLNSIQHYIISNKPDKANDYLIDFSKLARKVLKNSDSPEILLRDELQTIDMYVSLEMRRLNSSFEFKKEIDSSVQQEKCLIPALLIQPYIENSIWHGKLGAVDKAVIVLRILLVKERLHIEIEDNGLGYSNTIKNKRQGEKSYGIGVTKERLLLMEKLNTQLSKVVVSDAKNLVCTDINTGTLVQFDIPYILKT